MMIGGFVTLVDDSRAEFEFLPFLDRYMVWLVERWVVVDGWVGVSIEQVLDATSGMPTWVCTTLSSSDYADFFG